MAHPRSASIEGPASSSTELLAPDVSALHIYEHDILTVLMASDIASSLQPFHIILASDAALFLALPALMATIEKIARGAPDLGRTLADALRVRVSVSRSAKLRFLLLAACDNVGKFWRVLMIHSLGAYRAANLELNLEKEQLIVGAPAESIIGYKTKQVSVNEILKDHKKTLAYGRDKLFGPDGVPRKDHMYKMKVIKNSFFAYEAVNWVMRDTGLDERSDAVAVLQAMKDLGLLMRLGKPDAAFSDESKIWLEDSAATMVGKHHHHPPPASTFFDNVGKDIASLGKVATSGIIAVGEKAEKDVEKVVVPHHKHDPKHDLKLPLKAPTTSPPAEAPAVDHVTAELSILVDMVDLQSLDFWQRSIFTKGAAVKKGENFGYCCVSHPVIPTLSDEPYTKDPVTDGYKYIHVSNFCPQNQENAMSLSRLSAARADDPDDPALVAFCEVKIVFSSIAAPFILSLENLPFDEPVLEETKFLEVTPRVLVKTGDDLFQDMCTETFFRCCNSIWYTHRTSFKSKLVPFTHAYEIFPTGDKAGFMEALGGVTSLKDYDWPAWVERAKNNKDTLDSMVQSAAGAYIAAYCVGSRDRHWDNILIKDDRYLLHIDFGFLLGQKPPIDSPRFSVSPAMQAAFEATGIWSAFLELSADAFMVLRKNSAGLIRVATYMFPWTGLRETEIEAYLISQKAFNMLADDEAARDFVLKRISQSSEDWKTLFKSYSHEHIDPAFYAMLKKGFPPAVLAMKIVDNNKERSAKKSEKQEMSVNDKILASNARIAKSVNKMFGIKNTNAEK